MSKRAEEAALRAYPEKMGMFYEADIHYRADLNKAARIKYIEGYEQAEKDLALTWEDVKAIFKIADNYESELNRPKYLTQDYCQEILNRFNEIRKK